MKKKFHYTYRIDFPHQRWFYYGVHSTDDLDDGYAGSAVTHRDKWEWFEWEKTILEFFETREEAEELEIRLITATWKHKYSLNEHNCRSISWEAGKRGVQTQIANKLGIFSEAHKQKLKKEGKGCHDPKIREMGQKAGLKAVMERKVGYMNPVSRAKGGAIRAAALSKPIVLEHIETGEVCSFKSYKEAADRINSYGSSISYLVSGKLHQTKGWKLAS